MGLEQKKFFESGVAAERARTIETLSGHYEMLMDLADLASQDANDDGWYVDQAHTVQKCIELVKKQVN